MYDIFTPTIGIKCLLPVTYVWQPPRAGPVDSHHTHHFINSQHRVRCSFRLLVFALFSLWFTDHQLSLWTWIIFLDLLGIIHRLSIMGSQPSTTAASTSLMSPALDVAADRSCKQCSRRMSNYKDDKHTLCLHCRDVLCSVDVRCRKCSSWSTEMMQDYLKHRKSSVAKGKKNSVVSTPSSSSPLVPPSIENELSGGIKSDTNFQINKIYSKYDE